MPRINIILVRKILLYSIVVGVIFVSGYSLGAKGFRLETGSFPKIKIERQTPANRSDVDFNLFWRVWDTIEANYYDKSKINPATMVYGAISGMVGAIGDPYTSFLLPEENKVVEEDLSGSFEGIGIQIGFKGKQLAVISPLPKSPAEEAGIKAGDFIVGILDEANKVDRGTVGISLTDAVKLIRGKAGSKVTLVILRDGADEPLKIEIERKKLDVPSVVLEYAGENKNIAHLKVLKFGAETKAEWKKAVNEVNSNRNVTSLIIDLRNNPGGYLQAAVDLASEFVKSGTTIVIEDRSGVKTNFKSEGIGLFQNIKTVILVNEGSASASEILAGALRDIKSIKLIGKKTFGKGTIQEPMQLEKGAGLHITTARWLTPNEIWVNEKGLDPDVDVEDNTETEEDEQLLKAIELLK